MTDQPAHLKSMKRMEGDTKLSAKVQVQALAQARCTNPACSSNKSSQPEGHRSEVTSTPRSWGTKLTWTVLIAAGLLQTGVGSIFVYLWGIQPDIGLTLTLGSLAGILLLCIGTGWLLFLWLVARPTLRGTGVQSAMHITSAGGTGINTGLSTGSQICPNCGQELTSSAQQREQANSTHNS